MGDEYMHHEYHEYQDEEREEEDQETLPQAHESELTFMQACRKAATK